MVRQPSEDDRMKAAVAAIRETNAVQRFPAIQQFAEHHLEELDPAYWDIHTGSNTPTIDDVRRMIIADSTWEDEDCIVVDCTLPDDVTNYLLSVRMDLQGNVTDVDMES